MAIKASLCFTIFAPNLPSYFDSTGPSKTRINFSRWNNANAEKFTRHKRSQEDIERELRIAKKDELAKKMTDQQFQQNPTTPGDPSPYFKSVGTPSSPSRSSIPAKFSKYSKIPRNQKRSSNLDAHPAFRVPRITRVYESEKEKGIRLGDHGVSYKIPDAPFEFQYSYTETPKVKPLALREPPFAPFGPSTMPRPWTGRAPLSKKVLPEFDSFRLPPANKKGVKPVQAPGPFLPGSGGPKYVKTREEILGEPLTDEEVKALIQSCLKSTRQLNIGRDGLTHNMLDNIHAHWKRRRVCKIKCKGVCTVDMDNVHQQIEEKTGGKIIYSKGGVLYLFRGRNYNYRTRPRFPLMLWKPVTPVYPRLVKQAPEGLTLEEASEMRKRGRKLPPICKLGKNGVYASLVKHVKEAFEECELVRINCQGMNKSDYKKIGAKLKDLVPCVLISFEHEHILMWRGRDWKSSLPKDDLKLHEGSELTTDSSEDLSSVLPSTADLLRVSSNSSVKNITDEEKAQVVVDLSSSLDKRSVGLEETGELTSSNTNEPLPVVTDMGHTGRTTTDGMGRSDGLISMSVGTEHCAELETPSDRTPNHVLVVVPVVEAPVTEQMGELTSSNTNEPLLVVTDVGHTGTTTTDGMGRSDGLVSMADGTEHCAELETLSERAPNHDVVVAPVAESPVTEVSQGLAGVYIEGVILLRNQAIDSGMALLLDEDCLDANIIYEKVVELSKTAPPGPVFRGKPRKVVVKKANNQGIEEDEDLTMEVVTASKKRGSEGLVKNIHRRKEVYADEIPHGNLRVDELAKLLA